LIKIFSTNQKIPANFSTADKQKYTVLYQNAIKTKIIPAYKRMGDFQKKNICQKREIQTELMLFLMEAIFTRISQNLGLLLILLPMKSIKLGLRSSHAKSRNGESKTQLGFKGTLEQFLVSLKQTKKQCLIKRQKK
jgi:hypothetical protein